MAGNKSDRFYISKDGMGIQNKGKQNVFGGEELGWWEHFNITLLQHNTSLASPLVTSLLVFS